MSSLEAHRLDFITNPAAYESPCSSKLRKVIEVDEQLRGGSPSFLLTALKTSTYTLMTSSDRLRDKTESRLTDPTTPR